VGKWIAMGWRQEGEGNVCNGEGLKGMRPGQKEESGVRERVGVEWESGDRGGKGESERKRGRGRKRGG